jgi:hypothetical protein
MPAHSVKSETCLWLPQCHLLHVFSVNITCFLWFYVIGIPFGLRPITLMLLTFMQIVPGTGPVGTPMVLSLFFCVCFVMIDFSHVLVLRTSAVPFLGQAWP